MGGLLRICALQKRNRFSLAAQVAHMNEDLEYLQEESAYMISGTPDVEVWASCQLDLQSWLEKCNCTG